MAQNTREVKNRIRSVKNIQQITRALEAVSASRVRRAQERVEATRVYAEKAWEILLNVQSATIGQLPHPLLVEREEIKTVMIVLITSDRGLAGAYNSNVLRVATRFEDRMQRDTQYVAVGRKGRDSLLRLGKNVVAEFSDLPAQPTIADIAPINQLCVEAFLSGEVDEVVIAYTDFINLMTQSPVVMGWLPLTTHTTAMQVASEYVKEVPELTEGALDYEYEPGTAAVLDEIVPRFVELQLYQAFLESQASEHAARMNAMRSATDNAGELVEDLTLEYNKARQESITNEILDIVGGAAALEDSSRDDGHSEKFGPDSNGSGSGSSNEQSSSDADGGQQATATATAEAVATVATDEGDEDDLTRIEGIGPKMQSALKTAGIRTFAALAEASEDELRQAIEDAGMRLAPSLETWSEQAEYAASGDWDGLGALQEELEGGRRVN
jgi:F-type H+-transporting ATPase subunit gamma